MLRRFVVACFVLFCVVGLVVAAELKGKVKKVETKGKGTAITVTADDKDETFRVGGRTKVTDSKGDTLKADEIKEGSEVTVTYEEKERNGKKFKAVSEIKVNK